MNDPVDVSDLGKDRVLAIVLTFNAPRNAMACVEALNAQTRAVDEILIVENPGLRVLDAPAVELSSSVPIEVMQLPENVGPAGGYAAGLEAGARRDVGMIWLMDDDIAPEPACLSRLVVALREKNGMAVVAPISIDAATGEDSSTWGWCGVLTSSSLVNAIGLPLTELFYGLEDQNYLIDRAPLAGYELIREPSAIVRLGRRAGQQRPAWHYYYLPRNATYLYLYQRRHIPLVSRLKRLVAFHVRCFPGIFRHHADLRMRRVVFYGRGLFDGVLRRLGKRVAPTDERRPETPHRP